MVEQRRHGCAVHLGARRHENVRQRPHQRHEVFAEGRALGVAAAGTVEIEQIFAADDNEGSLPTHFGVGENAFGIGQRAVAAWNMVHGIDLDVLHPAQLVISQALADDRFVLSICVDQITDRHDGCCLLFYAIHLLYHKCTLLKRFMRKNFCRSLSAALLSDGR